MNEGIFNQSRQINDWLWMNLTSIQRPDNMLLLISWQCKKQTIVVNSTTEVEYVVAASCCGQVLEVNCVTMKLTDEAVIKEWKDRVERSATTASSLEAEQDSGSGPRCQDTILGVQKLKLGLRLHLNSPMIHLSQELTHLEVGRTT
ncbi:hypothetical protein Tco_0906009 [Tanacetum coccineum]